MRVTNWGKNRYWNSQLGWVILWEEDKQKKTVYFSREQEYFFFLFQFSHLIHLMLFILSFFVCFRLESKPLLIQSSWKRFIFSKIQSLRQICCLSLKNYVGYSLLLFLFEGKIEVIFWGSKSQISSVIKFFVFILILIVIRC